ncbi:MAG: hypothetical protein GTO14_18865 [Anaerolineales bacterium]|nr:hypothetical protein [Anaerolineales bacterium]
MSQRGQILIVIAVLILVVLLLLAVAVDAGRLYIERARMQRAAHAAADAGISVVAEQMVTQAVARQTLLAATPSPTGPAVMTATPPLWDVQAWLTDEDRAALVSSSVQAAVIGVAMDYAERNGYDTSDPETILVSAEYPQAGYTPDDPDIRTLRFSVIVRRRTIILLAGLLGEEFVELSVEGMSEIPQR